MININEITSKERRYNDLALRMCNKINRYVLKSKSGNSLLTIATGTQYRCIQNGKIDVLKQLMVDVLLLNFEENFPVSKEPIIKQILLWIENRLSLQDDAPKSASGKIENPFFELTFDGIVCERGLQYVSYINTLKTFLFEIRSYLSVKVNLKAFSKFVLSDKTIDIYSYLDLKECYEIFQQQSEYDSQLANEYMTLYCLQGFFEAREAGIYICDYQNTYFKKIVHYVVCCINKGIKKIDGLKYAIIDDNKISKLKINYNFLDYLKFYKMYYIQYSICANKYFYKSDCISKLKKNPPLDQCIKISFFGVAPENKEEIYDDFLYMKEIYETILNIDLEQELDSLFNQREITSGNKKNSPKDNVIERNNESEKSDESLELNDSIKQYLSRQMEEVLVKFQTELQNANIKLEENIIESKHAITKRIDDIEATYSAFIEDIEDKCKEISGRVHAISERIIEYNELLLVTCQEKKEEALNVVLKNKIDAIRDLIQKNCPDLESDNSLIFQLSLMVSDNDVEMIEQFLFSIHEEEYKEKYLSKVGIKQLTIYTFESNLGNCILFKKDGKKHILELDMFEDLQIKEFRDFIINCSKSMLSDIYFDNDIFAKLEELLTNAKKSIYMIVPWVYEYPTFKHYASFLEAAEKRKVDIYLKYGYKSIGSNEESNKTNLENFKRSTQNVKKLKDEYIHSLKYKDDDTHIKALIIDESLVFIGSCNYLSFRCNYTNKPDFRHETMVLLHDTELAKCLISYYEA